MMKFKEYQDSLNRKRYRPLPQAELNAMVIENRDLDKVADSCQRLIVKAMGSIFHFNAMSDDMLMEYVQVGNHSIAEAIVKYTEDKIDFAYFCYIHIINGIRSYAKLNQSTVKSALVEGERFYASYFHIDAPVRDDEESFDIAYQQEFKVSQIDLKLIYELIKEQHHLFKPYYLDVYAAYIGMDGEGGKKKVEVAEEFGISDQRVYQIIKDVEDKMKENEKIIRYLAEF